MISERTFLMKIFARKDASDEMREMIIKRCEELDEAPIDYRRPVLSSVLTTNDPVLSQQAPSMQRIMEQHSDIIPRPPQPVSAAAAQALAARQALMNGASNEKPELGMKSKRKI